MKTALVNGDYELNLFQQELGSASKGFEVHRRAIDFLFFFINKDPTISLLPQNNYSEEYLEMIASLGLHTPKFEYSQPTFNWYGQLADIALEKKMNSKIWSYELLNKMKLNPCENHVVSNQEQVRKKILNSSFNRWILKSPFQMAGRDFHLLNSEEDIPEIQTDYILEPNLDRFIDMAFFYCPKTKEQFYYINKAAPNGRYLGGTVFQRESDLEAYFHSLGAIELYAQWRSSTEMILDELLKYNLQQTISIDSFLYKSKGRIKLHPMCDINYRMNMGALLNSLKPFLSSTGVGEFYLLSHIQKNIDWSALRFNSELKRGIIQLTPKYLDPTGLFFCGNSMTEAMRIRRLFFQNLGV